MHEKNGELVESLHQFITIWKLIGKPFPQVDGKDKPGLAISWPNTRFPFYNALFLTEQMLTAHVLEERVQEAAAYMRGRPYGGWFVVCLDDLSGSAKENLGAILDRAKCVQAIPMTGMEGDILQWTRPDTRRFDSYEFRMTRRYSLSQSSIAWRTAFRSRRACPL